jgi:ankyrin repeat protein
MNIKNLLSCLFHSQLSRLAIVLLVMLACSSSAFCGEIHDAVYAGDLQKVKALLLKKPKLVSSKASDLFRGYPTPLHLAAEKGHKDIVELLLAKGADVNARNFTGKTPLQVAAVNGWKKVVELLLAHKADVNLPDNHGVTPLLWAEQSGKKDIAELLRQRGGRE